MAHRRSGCARLILHGLALALVLLGIHAAAIGTSEIGTFAEGISAVSKSAGGTPTAGTSGQTEHPVRAELIASATGIQPGRPIWIGIRLRMDNHWHTYWMNPGDAGLATAVEWRLPPGITAGELLWPYPRRFEAPSVVSYGYEGETVLLTQMQADASLSPGDALTIGARVEWLACREECLPGEAELTLELPVRAGSSPRDDPWSEEFASARRKLPQNIPDWKVNALADPERIRLQVVPPRRFARAMDRIVFFPALRGLIDHGRDVTFRNTDLGYFLEIPRSRLMTKLPARLTGVLYSDAGWDEEGSLKALWLDSPLHVQK